MTLLSHRYKQIPLDQIWLRRSERQRREIDVEDLLPSIGRNGVLVPIIVHEEPGPNGEPFRLVAGERRLTASIALRLPFIPARLSSDLAPTELQIVELEENIKRQDLTWLDDCCAIVALHSLYVAMDPEWTQAQTAEAISLSPAALTKRLRVHEHLANPLVSKSPTLNAAYNIVTKGDERRVADALGDIISGMDEIFEGKPKEQEIGNLNVSDFEDGLLYRNSADSGMGVGDASASSPAPRPAPAPPVPPVPSEELDILNTSFLEWASGYTGLPFNLIHCDFPYGVNVFSGPLAGRDKWENYDDSRDTYYELINCLCENLDRLMLPSAHLVFWLSADVDIVAATLRHFRERAPSLRFNTFPLIWMKSDNVGLLPDHEREARRIYEVALYASREDRKILRPKSNAYAAPTNKDHHPSTKPEPMLRYFFEMFVDENTRLLDPTCGSGTALRAAESLGAKTVKGLEMSPEYCKAARDALRTFRLLRQGGRK